MNNTGKTSESAVSSDLYITFVRIPYHDYKTQSIMFVQLLYTLPSQFHSTPSRP